MRPPHGQQRDTPLNPTNSQLTFSPLFPIYAITIPCYCYFSYRYRDSPQGFRIVTPAEFNFLFPFIFSPFRILRSFQRFPQNLSRSVIDFFRFDRYRARTRIAYHENDKAAGNNFDSDLLRGDANAREIRTRGF